MEFWALVDAQSFTGKPELSTRWLDDFVKKHKETWKGSALNNG